MIWGGGPTEKAPTLSKPWGPAGDKEKKKKTNSSVHSKSSFVLLNDKWTEHNIKQSLTYMFKGCQR